MNATRKPILIALGGNAIARHGDDGTVVAQYRRAQSVMAQVARLIADGARLVLTHGNGPVVGNIVLRGELARSEVPPTPLYIADADSEGGIGLMLQQVLGNELKRLGSDTVVATVVTQVVVDSSDSAFTAPTKPIGPYYTAEEAQAARDSRGWTLAEETGRGWRRVVASPRPLRIVETGAVAALVSAGIVPIAAGGGGVPVVEDAYGALSGVDAVIDKDWTAAVLADALGAETLLIAMEADALYEEFGTPFARRVGHLTPDAATRLAPGLPKGGIGPKVAASAWFAQGGGVAIMCSTQDVLAALEGRTGTRVSFG